MRVAFQARECTPPAIGPSGTGKFTRFLLDIVIGCPIILIRFIIISNNLGENLFPLWEKLFTPKPMADGSRAQDRRRSLRLNAQCPCTYTRFDDQGRPYDQRPCQTLDLSSEGLGLQSDFPVDSGETLRIAIALGDNLVSFNGRVAHVDCLPDRGFRFGIAIRDIGKMERIALTRFIYYFNPTEAG